MTDMNKGPPRSFKKNLNQQHEEFVVLCEEVEMLGRELIPFLLGEDNHENYNEAEQFGYHTDKFLGIIQDYFNFKISVIRKSIFDQSEKEES